ncbi:MAG: 5-dehydro-2-deoxygluconokinase [Cobetia sp.]|mgnify:FL=1|jgi:5-dehydro-2-deoxygluconokinase|uniref:bifunctional 5-dehydro-2-deoxygluconokinase/5-dehydro-2- deoxyphosphogluconate aldolase n=1 Tax=Cobetia TaxID=204286 RepID=UPI001C03DA3B|nr:MULTISPECIES: 5-dehydro-2-deoxygluconokinase [Cobetia]MDH2298387.1 5-dehydro-2-deoxygluconokinase [Cobetia sp. 29-18-1]QWN38173.1 5-dehydro-2-deoxygluconokinase [Cobetia sp. 4B]UBU49981.1 5-dehydro-2-deoxygluconokinase [Cobetia amphilecti]
MTRHSPHSPDLDVICLGRVAVDLYAEQIGARLEDATSFKKYLGGSSGNMAYGTARLGLKSSMLARVGNEQMGEFLREELTSAGCDVSHLIRDPERLTGLVLLGIKDKDQFPLLFVRNDCADMAIDEDDVDPAFISRARALAITGTHLSTPRTQRAARKALDAARNAGVKRVLDIDYRPVLWGLTSIGDGETRFVADESVSQHMARWLGDFDLIVGTEEEFHIAGNSTDTLEALREVRRHSEAVLVCKIGARGCVIFEEEIPQQLEDGILVEGVKVEVMNVLGAGDAFMSGFLRGYLRDESWETCGHYANACGALVVSRHGCAPAMPTEAELFDYLSRRESVPRPDLDDHLTHLHRVTTRRVAHWDSVLGLAFDHRRQFLDMARDVEGNPDRLPRLKQLLVQATRTAAQQAGITRPAILCDDVLGQDALNDTAELEWWVGRPVELPSSRPLRFQHGDDIGSQLRRWPRHHIVKCLVFYHPDDEATLRLDQEARLRQLYDACCISGHELLIEVIPPRQADAPTCDETTIPRSLERLYNLGIRPDWWKLPALTAQGWEKVNQIISTRDSWCHGVVLLGLDAPIEDVKRGFEQAARFPICKGFTVGRTLFTAPSQAWLSGTIDDATLTRQAADNYLELITHWQKLRDAYCNAEDASPATTLAEGVLQ